MGDSSPAEDFEVTENLDELHETASHSSLEDEETNPHWDIGSGDLAIYNDVPKDRNVSRFLQRAKSEIVNFLTSVLLRKKNIKYNIILVTKLNPTVNEYAMSGRLSPVRSSYISLENTADVAVTYDVLAALVDLKSREKNSYVHQILRIEINIKKMSRQCGAYIELPPNISSLKAVINFRNNNNYCFKYAILVGIKYLSKTMKTVPIEKVDIRSEVIPYGGLSLNFSDLTFPLKVMDVRLFEKNNPSISVSVFEIQKKTRAKRIVESVYRTRQKKGNHLNLLFLENSKKYLTHYAYICNLKKLKVGYAFNLKKS